jgi:SAM-dependent methyltransferase
MKIAHFAAFCPGITGQYATVKDMIDAERAVGIDAQFIATSVNSKKETEFAELQEDGWLKTVDHTWARGADILMRHSCIPASYLNLGIPIMMSLHGRPESTFIIEYDGMMRIYQLMAEVKNDYRYKGWITFWKEHEFFHKQKLPKDKVYYVPAMVDLDEYNPEGKATNFAERGGEPNILIADMWRHDMTPYTMLYAAALFKEKYCPDAKVQIFGVPKKKADTVIRLMKANGVIGNMTHRVWPMGNVYRAGDLLITPHNIATRVVRESLACGIPIVAGSANKFTKYKADPRDIESFAKQINKCWQKIKESPGQLQSIARKTAEREFNKKKAGKAILKACKDVLRKEAEGWTEKEKIFFRNYDKYKDYEKHQTSKMKSNFKVGEKYQKVYKASLTARIKEVVGTGRFNTGMSVLCLGARDGTEVQAFHDAGFFAVGIDLLPVSSNYVLKGDFHNLPYPRNSVDMVFMNCIDHVHDLDKLLKEIIRVLRRDGIFLVDFSQSKDTSKDKWASCKWNTLCDIGFYIKRRGFSVELVTKFNDSYFVNMICFRSLGGLHRADAINTCIEKKNFQSYLEIGSKEKETFDRIVCDKKVSIDPNFDADYHMTSDEYFKQNGSEKYDIVFVDGCHDAEQVYRDINNSLRSITPDGMVLVHDCNPAQEYLQSRLGHEVLENDNWCGDGWKAFAKIRMTRDDLTAYVINSDYGIGVIHKGGQTIYPENIEMSKMTWSYLKENRKELLRLREPEEWMAK